MVSVVIIISANAEWVIVKNTYQDAKIIDSPYGEWFSTEFQNGHKVIFFQGGWGKIQAAASTQYAIDQWSPKCLINIGTCGGFEGEIKNGTIILVEKTIVYDIIERMGDHTEHIDYYSTDLDLSWLDGDYPIDVVRTRLISGDQDLNPSELPNLKFQYGAIAGDWESGAIAFVAKRNNVHCLILRGVTDLVNNHSGEAYNGNISVFHNRTITIMNELMNSLPHWVSKYVEAT